MEAVSAYFKTLRERRQISRSQFAAVVGISTESVWRIEEKSQEPKPAILAKIIEVLGAPWGDVASLLLSEAAADEGERRATRVQLDTPPDPLGFTPEELAALARLSPGKKQALLDLIDRFESDA